MNDLEKRVRAIEERNKQVEQDKAWETSLARRLIVALLTLLLIGIYLNWLNVSQPWLNAVVPTLGFFLSTLVLQKAKYYWAKNRKS